MQDKKKTPMWVKFPEIWGTQAKYMAWIRGGIRLGLWKKSPVKLEFLKSKTFMIDNTNPRSMKRFPQVKACKCEQCGEIFKSSEVEVDHIDGNHSLKDMDDVRKFIDSIVEVDFSMLQILCTSCHKIKSHAEKSGISFEEARVEKEVIAIMNSKKEKEWLTKHGVVPGSNAKIRRQQVAEALNKNINKEGD